MSDTWRHLLIAIAIVLPGAIFCASPVSASELVFTEDFSHGFDKWEATRDQGEPWLISNGRADVTLEMGSTVTELVPKDEFWDSSWKNFEYSLDYTPILGVDRNISFNVQNNVNWYEIHFVDTFFNLVRVQNGQQPFDVFYPYVMENGQTYRIKIRFQAGLIQVYSNNVLIAQEFDSSFTNNFGKIGIKVSTGAVFPTRVQFDNIQVSLLPEGVATLIVEKYQQHDLSWGNSEYDTAHLWSSNPTITRWGCALTSAAMILQYHGIKWLPTGQDLTPLTLNSWLNSQADGYLGNGLVNWMALTRLTKLVSLRHQTPKLEYRRVTTEIFPQAQAAFSAAEPVIFEIPGHFVVGTGLTANLHDAWIADPFYDYQKLSQHPGGPVSLRLFKPSHTDLSYLIITSQAPITMFLSDQQNSYLSEAEIFTETLSSTGADEAAQTLTVLQLVKPSSQTYTLLLPSANNLPFDLKIYHYDSEGEVQLQTASGTVTTSGTMIPITYQKEPPTWLDFQTVLQEYDQQGKIPHLAYIAFNHFSSAALEVTPTIQIHYTRLILGVLSCFQNLIDQETFGALNTLIIRIQTTLIATQGNS